MRASEQGMAVQLGECCWCIWGVLCPSGHRGGRESRSPRSHDISTQRVVMMKHTAWRRAGRILAASGLLLIAVAVVAPVSAGAAAGNNGTIKIDGADIKAGKDNDPHVGCGFDVEWFDFDAGAQHVDLTFDAQPPTGNVNLVTDSFDPPAFAAAGQQLSKHYDLSAAIQAAGLTPQPSQGFHVKLEIHTTAASGSDIKQKTIWVLGCFGPTVTALACAGPAGTPLFISVSITNNDVDQTFSVVEDGGAAVPHFVASGATVTFLLPQLPAGDTITITSGINPALVVTRIIAANNCGVVDRRSVTLDKVVTGAAPAGDPLYDFTVTCAGLGAVVPASPVHIRESDAAAIVATNVPVGTDCTITETGNNGASSTTHTVNGGVAAAGGAVTFTV